MALVFSTADNLFSVTLPVEITAESFGTDLRFGGGRNSGVRFVGVFTFNKALDPLATPGSTELQGTLTAEGTTGDSRTIRIYSGHVALTQRRTTA